MHFSFEFYLYKIKWRPTFYFLFRLALNADVEATFKSSNVHGELAQNAEPQIKRMISIYSRSLSELKCLFLCVNRTVPCLFIHR